MKDYKEKIKKLLALSSSSNEHEAKAALLKARELMALYKIEEIDLEDVKRKEVKKVYTDITYTKRGEYWIPTLANVIAENYCCRCASVVHYKEQKRNMLFVGFEEDVNLCVKIFEYAVETARLCSKLYVRRNYKSIPTKDKRDLENSYALGFASGVKEAFIEQEDKEKGWGLVMCIPQEVNDACNFSNDSKWTKKTVYTTAKSAGFEEGSKFKPTRRLG